ncbi:helix-turn-helix transcriptional regulator [Saccharothrix longispora]|uniref:Transcriptional regulator with XRE-family HTH domain n=1 Tax=Saccharothrix longispora TaxID=33920 RepID=A0ABU1Q597_9PSEU|nr:helix-turn-helix transcriptional regulator [Saccharothrix longispora]MDR6598072.1 transcriptional regulator with XRE-family HTH domain [Saccharothrix longispora]
MESNARARTLGAELRDLRKARGMSIVRLGERVGLSKSMLSRIERGERFLTETELASVLGAMGVVGVKRRELLALTRDASRSNWLATGADLPRQLKALVEYEQVATAITDVTALLVPGLLQVPEYTRAIMVESGLARADAEARVKVRLDRQRVLTRVHYLAILDESVLRRPIGGRAVLAAQARHLLEVADLPNVTLRVVREERGWYPGLFGSFALLEFDRTAPVVHLEHLRPTVFLDKPEDVQAYMDIKPTLLAAAASAEDSVGVIAGYAKEYEQ